MTDQEKIEKLRDALSKFVGYGSFVKAYAELSEIELKDSTCITSIQGGGGSDYLWWEDFKKAMEVWDETR